jgi:NADH:ubiquinone oxidoreductase subunit 2 (subunit N)
MMAILILLLAATSSLEVNKNYLADYVKFNRIVLLIFILGGYLAYNVLNVDAFGNGISIYGSVFKVTVLSQVFDIVLFITGGIVTILTCFVPYNIKKYDDSESMKYIMDSETGEMIKWRTHYTFYKSHFKNDYYLKLLSFYPHNDYNNQPPLFLFFIKFMKRVTEFWPDIRIKTPYLVKNKSFYSKLEVKEYSLLLLYTVLGGSLLISSQNLISLYLSLELQSFTLYILSSSQVRSFKGTSGGLKYFLLGGLSSGFILLGCSLLYAYTGTLNLDHIFMIYSDSLSNYFIDPCLLILFAGLLFKVSAVPFHNWAPDVYSDVPTYSTTWLIVIAKLSVLVLMLVLIHSIHTGLNINNLNSWEQYYSLNMERYANIELDPQFLNFKEDSKFILGINSLYISNNIPFSFFNPSYSSLGLWTNVLTLSAIFSLIIGTVLGISQSRIKRLFAYSTITHVGFLLLALSLNSVVSLDAFIFYLIQYTITNLNLFFIIIAWGYLYSRYYLDDDFLPVRYVNINPYSWKDIYIEPTLYDFFNSIQDEIHEWEKYIDLFYPRWNIKVNTIHNYLLLHRGNLYYDFKSDDTEWLYTPVPFITQLKGMHSSDPFLAFCLAITIFSLAGECLKFIFIYFKINIIWGNVYILIYKRILRVL